MIDKYQRLRDALEAEELRDPDASSDDTWRAVHHVIAAADPDTIRALLDERDRLRELLSESLEAMTCGDAGDDIEDSHRCGRCDEYVDRNAELRTKIHAALDVEK